MGVILKAIKSPAAKAIFTAFPELRHERAVRRPGRPTEYRFWQKGGGYDRNIFRTNTIWDVIRYIHANPVRRGLCQSPLDWKWSRAVGYADVPTLIPIDRCIWSDDLGRPYKLERW